MQRFMSSDIAMADPSSVRTAGAVPCSGPTDPQPAGRVTVPRQPVHVPLNVRNMKTVPLGERRPCLARRSMMHRTAPNVGTCRADSALVPMQFSARKATKGWMVWDNETDQVAV